MRKLPMRAPADRRRRIGRPQRSVSSTPSLLATLRMRCRYSSLSLTRSGRMEASVLMAAIEIGPMEVELARVRPASRRIYCYKGKQRQSSGVIETGRGGHADRA